MSNTSNARLTYILCINDRMLKHEERRTDRPRKGDNFSILHITFVCKNSSNKDLSEDDPVIGEIDATRHSPVHRAIEALIADGAMELSDEEKEEIFTKYAPGLRTVPAVIGD